jgi:hypothetical protein
MATKKTATAKTTSTRKTTRTKAAAPMIVRAAAPVSPAPAPAPTVTIAPPPVSAAAIALRAYDYFVARGYQHGHDVDDWLRAEQELRVARY